MCYSVVYCECGGSVRFVHALHWISDIKFDKVDFVLDSKTTIDAFHMNQIDVTEFAYVITSCRKFFVVQFTNSKVEFHRRQTNEIDKTLVMVAILSASLATYFHVSNCVITLIVNGIL